MGLEFTNADQADGLVPADSIHRAKLLDISKKSIPYRNKDGKNDVFDKLVWAWEITASTDGGDEWVGKRVFGECPPVMNNSPTNKMRNWAETLLGNEIPIGGNLDTDDLLGLQALVSIGHRVDKQDRTWVYVDEVMPTDGDSFGLNEPPF